MEAVVKSELRRNVGSSTCPLACLWRTGGGREEQVWYAGKGKEGIYSVGSCRCCFTHLVCYC